jgi:6-phosphogluconolactonase
VTVSVPRQPARRLWLLALALAGLSGLAIGPATAAAKPPAKWAVGAVYSETNGVPNNEVIVYDRRANGRLKQREVVETGGAGGLAPQPGCAPPGGCPMLDTQGEVIVKGRLVFVVNAGSDTISVFRETSRGLKLRDEIRSRGDFPNSITVHGRILYVLNSHSDSIAGFRFTRRGKIRFLRGSVEALSQPADPALVGGGLTPRQIGFDNTGRVLVVSLLSPLPGSIDTFKLNARKRPRSAKPHPPTTPLPFGFAFDNNNNLVMSQVSAPPELGMNGSTATYDLNTRNGNLTPIETESANGVAPCWVVVTHDGRYTFVVNTGGGPPGPQFAATIAGYRLSNGGALTFLGLTPENNANGDEFARTDEALSRDSKYLYVLKPGLMGDVSQVDIYRVNQNGSLTLLGNTPATGAAGQSGLAAR